MEKLAFIEALKALTSQEDPLAVSRDVSELRTKFDDVVLEEQRKFQVAQLEARERGEEPQEAEEDDVREQFYAIYTEYKDRRNAAQQSKKDAEATHLREKRALIERLRNVIKTEENIGSALTQYKEIHDAWKTIGDIPREKRQEVQSEYSRLLEEFFYHLKIYRELREHDLHRNHQLKLEVVQKIQQLDKLEQIKEVEAAIKALQHEWDETGPVNNDDWETLKTAYWDAVRVVYARIHAFYEERRSELSGNLEKKKEVVKRAQELIAKQGEWTANKDWELVTEQLLALQEEWKLIGFGPRKENEEIWKEFRGICDSFFTAKKAFFDVLRSQFDGLASKKQELIDKVNALKDSTDWKATTEQILKIQKQWKETGNAGQRNEQKLWKEFRAACDHFFTAKQTHFATQDQELAGNYDAKIALIEQIKAAQLSEDKREALAQLKEFSTAFMAIGFVPMKQKDAVYNAYRDALNGHYQKLKLEGEEQERVLFQARVDTLKANPNADKMLARERADLFDKMHQLKADILQYENNLGFFARSKGASADALRKEVDQKIEAAKRKIEDIQRKIKQL
jgi:hypothetical protein